MSKSRFEKLKEKIKNIFHHHSKDPKTITDKVISSPYSSSASNYRTKHKRSDSDSDYTRRMIANTAFMYGALGATPSDNPAPCDAPPRPCDDYQPTSSHCPSTDYAPVESYHAPVDTGTYSAPVDVGTYSAPAAASSYSAPCDSGASYSAPSAPCDSGCSNTMSL